MSFRDPRVKYFVSPGTPHVSIVPSVGKVINTWAVDRLELPSGVVTTRHQTTQDPLVWGLTSGYVMRARNCCTVCSLTLSHYNSFLPSLSSSLNVYVFQYHLVSSKIFIFVGETKKFEFRQTDPTLMWRNKLKI